MKKIWNNLKLIYQASSEDKIATYAAALAYYALFAVGPIIWITVLMAHLIVDDEIIRTSFISYASQWLGHDLVQQLQSMMNVAKSSSANVMQYSEHLKHPGFFNTFKIPVILSLLVLFFGASGFFIELQAGFNAIWRVRLNTDESLWTMIKKKLILFLIVIGAAITILVSTLLSVVISMLDQYLQQSAIGQFHVASTIDFIFSFTTYVILFGLLFKAFPDKKLSWHDVWLGAIASAGLFIFGKIGLNYYFNSTHIINQFGVAGSIIVLMMWIYYSAQILFLGAEFTKIYASKP